jgi:hypothetical protein
MKFGILMGGLGWIVAGIISVAAWLLESNDIMCNCPAIPANATAQQISLACSCAGNVPVGLLVIGIVVMAAGILLLAFNKRIGKAISRSRR